MCAQVTPYPLRADDHTSLLIHSSLITGCPSAILLFVNTSIIRWGDMERENVGQHSVLAIFEKKV